MGVAENSGRGPCCCAGCPLIPPGQSWQVPETSEDQKLSFIWLPTQEAW